MIGETNINGGAGLNGKGALLKIKAPTGSIITVSKDSYSETIKVSQLDPDDNNWSYWIFQTTDFGEWTVTAIRQSDQETESKTITVSNNEQYDIFLSYKFWLYNKGVISTAAGDFIRASSGIAGWNNGTLTKGSTTIKGSTRSEDYVLAISTSNKVDLTDYSRLVFNVVGYAAGSSVNMRGIVILNSKSFTWNGAESNPDNHFIAAAGVNKTGIVTLDISSYHSTYYIGFAMRGDNITIEANEIYLSR